MVSGSEWGYWCLVSGEGGVWSMECYDKLFTVLIIVLYFVVTEVHLVCGKLACIAHRLLLTDYLKVKLRRTSCHNFQAALIIATKTFHETMSNLVVTMSYLIFCYRRQSLSVALIT